MRAASLTYADNLVTRSDRSYFHWGDSARRDRLPIPTRRSSDLEHHRQPSKPPRHRPNRLDCLVPMLALLATRSARLRSEEHTSDVQKLTNPLRRTCSAARSTSTITVQVLCAAATLRHARCIAHVRG